MLEPVGRIQDREEGQNLCDGLFKGCTRPCFSRAQDRCPVAPYFRDGGAGRCNAWCSTASRRRLDHAGIGLGWTMPVTSW
jgi:hypothetical protein